MEERSMQQAVRQLAICLQRSASVLVLSLLPIAGFAQSGKLLPPPPDGEVTQATQALATAYRKEYEEAKSVPQKQALAAKLLMEAQNAQEPAKRFALFQVARNMAVDVYDIDYAMQVIDRLAATFAIDEGAYRRDAISVLAPNLKSNSEQATLARHAQRVLKLLVKRDRFPAAVELAEVGLASAKKAGDKDVIQQWTRRRDELALQAAEFARLKPVWETLQKTPLDPATNARAGKFYCFIKRDWEHGLPMLALGDDAALQALAEKDLRSQPNEDAILADAWYDWAQDQQQPAKGAALAYASVRYFRALPKLEGISQKRVENRLNDLAPTTTAFVKNEWTEILDLVQLPRDIVRDQWQREGLWLVSRKDQDNAAFSLPIAVAGNYDLRVRATVRSGPEFLAVGLGPDLHAALLGINAHEGKACGIDLVDGKGVLDNPTKVPAIALESNRSHVLLIAVEASQGIASIVANVDDKPIIRWRGATSSLSMTKDWPQDRLVITSHRTSIAVESVELRLRSGGAWKLE
jgi:hypothetical protein